MTEDIRPAADSTALAVLNELLEIVRDGEFGFQTCADEVAIPHLQRFFYHRAECFHEAADELVRLIWRFGGTPAEGGTPPGFTPFKGAVIARNDLSMLEECERREDAAIARCRKALKQGDLPPEVRSFVERHAHDAERSNDQLRDLRKTMRPDHAL